MTRETKAGLIVTASFLGLLGAVIAKKFMDPPAPDKGEPKGTQVAANNKSGVTPVLPSAMELQPVPSKEGIVLTNGEENKGAPPIPPPPPVPMESGPGGIPPLPGSPAEKSAIPPLPGEAPKAELPPLPGSIPPPPPVPASGGVSIPPPPPIPKPMESVASPGSVIPPPLPVPVPTPTPTPTPMPVPAISPIGSPDVPMAASPPIPPPGLSGNPAGGVGLPVAPIGSAPVSVPPPLPGAGIGSAVIAPPPPPPPAPGFDTSTPPALSSTSPMPRSTSTIYNATSGPGVRSEFIPADPSAVGRPVGNIPPAPVNSIAPIPVGTTPVIPANPNQIISAPPIPGTTPVPIVPGAGAVLTIPSNNGPFGSPANNLTTPSAPIPSVAPVTPPAATLAPPRVESWSEQSYVAVAGDTYEIIGQKIYRSNDYGKALQMWNENHPRARFDAPKNGLIVPGQEIYYPPTSELARRFGNYLPKVSPVGAINK